MLKPKCYPFSAASIYHISYLFYICRLRIRGAHFKIDKLKPYLPVSISYTTVVTYLYIPEISFKHS